MSTLMPTTWSTGPREQKIDGGMLMASLVNTGGCNLFELHSASTPRSRHMPQHTPAAALVVFTRRADAFEVVGT